MWPIGQVIVSTKNKIELALAVVLICRSALFATICLFRVFLLYLHFNWGFTPSLN